MMNAYGSSLVIMCYCVYAAVQRQLNGADSAWDLNFIRKKTATESERYKCIIDEWRNDTVGVSSKIILH